MISLSNELGKLWYGYDSEADRYDLASVFAAAF
jgi:hypothetical protein